MYEAVVNEHFVQALPKAELHAHLSGSISVQCLRGIWLRKRIQGKCLDIEDPKTAIRPGGQYHDVISFFPLFDRYIYNLCNDVESIRYATRSVLEVFQKDGVVHLELRTTPGENTAIGLTEEIYVKAIQEAICEFDSSDCFEYPNTRMVTTLILSIDRRMTKEQAMDVVELAVRYQHTERRSESGKVLRDDLRYVVGLDLCGNPAKGDISVFAGAFAKAKSHGLGITLHFAEMPKSSSDEQLRQLLSWNPDRLGHVINVSPEFAKIIAAPKLGLELCLSCNVLAKLTTGGFAMHHFGQWRQTDCPIALGTDDIVIFDSPLSNEYLLAATHFHLSPKDLIGLSKSAAMAAFSGRERLLSLIDRFEGGGIGKPFHINR